MKKIILKKDDYEYNNRQHGEMFLVSVLQKEAMKRHSGTKGPKSNPSYLTLPQLS